MLPGLQLSAFLTCVQMTLIKTRTWNNTEWPGLILVQLEKPEGNKKDYITLGEAFDLIMLAEFEFPASHASQAQRFCDVLQRGCRGVPEDAETRRWLYDKARLKYAKLDRSKQAAGGYLHS